MSHICLKEVEKSFGNTRVLQPLNLTINKGEFLVLVGPSGCGKSTLLRMIAGLEQPTGGDILINGKSALNVPPKDRNLAMVFQSYALYPHMTVAQNMGLALKIRKVHPEKIAEEVNRVASILGLSELLTRKPSSLSGGQRQRVAMGRAIVRKPQAFLFDEPLSNLDASLRLKVRTEIKKRHQSLKTTTLYVTHDQMEAMTLADRIVVLKDGIIQQIGTPLEIFDTPQNKFVAGFMGSPKMNFVNLNKEGTLFREIAKDSYFSALNQVNMVENPPQLGIRPEHLNFKPGPQSIFLGEAKVNVREPLGSEVLLEVAFLDQEITVKAPFQSGLPIEDQIKLFALKDHLRFFDKESGSLLS